MLNAESANRGKRSDKVVLTDFRLKNSNNSILFADHEVRGHIAAEAGAFDRAALRQGACCRPSLQHVCSKEMLCKRLPILTWLPHYSRVDAMGDLIAGITVGLLVVPQGLAYANIAGLPTQFGLYGAFFGSFLYVLLGTCKDNTVGSTAIGSLLLFQVANGVWQRAVLLTFLTGIIEILMAIFRLSFLVDFVSGPVNAGFTSAAACIVLTTQVRHILGIQGGGNTFLQRWITMISDINNISLADAALGSICICVLLAMRFIGRLRFTAKCSSWHRQLNAALWFFGTTRNALMVIISAFLCRYLELAGNNPFKLTGFIPPGLPEFRLPAFSIAAVPGNVTTGVMALPEENFVQMVQNLGFGFVIVPLVAMVENSAVCRTFAKGKSVDATQELFTTGVANIANSLVSGYRTNGGLTRASVSNASGSHTPMTNLYIGAVVMLALLFLTDFFYYIPKTVLAAIIISAVIFQIQIQLIMPMWHSKATELIPALVAFLACLVIPLELGIFVAIGVNLLFILYYSARPKVNVEILKTPTEQTFLKLTPDRCLMFPAVDFVRNIIAKQSLRTNMPVVLDGTYVYGADFTAAKAISSIVADFKLRQQQIIFFNLRPSVVDVFEGVLSGKLNVCYSMEALELELDDTKMDFNKSDNQRF